ncbi:MAG TPA: hypothetical protein VLE93_03015 [Candidatus Saccharimonadales bacterium]|nr:hypothetical protein [Candidatus Saccharimonadales bacterium]
MAETENTFRALGLSKNAAVVYESLLELGNTTIGGLQDKTQLHPQLIYNAIDELQREGLATYAVESGRRRFQPGSPAVLLEMERERLDKVENILPSLMHKFKTKQHQAVFVYSGNEDFQKARERVIRSISRGGTYYVINNGGKRFKQAMEGTYTEAERVRIKRGVHKKVVDFADSFKEMGAPEGEAEKLAEYRYLPDTDGGPTSTLFGGEYLRINVWGSPVLTILIQNRELVESYKKYFDVLWTQAIEPK